MTVNREPTLAKRQFPKHIHKNNFKYNCKMPKFLIIIAKGRKHNKRWFEHYKRWRETRALQKMTGEERKCIHLFTESELVSGIRMTSSLWSFSSWIDCKTSINISYIFINGNFSSRKSLASSSPYSAIILLRSIEISFFSSSCCSLSFRYIVSKLFGDGGIVHSPVLFLLGGVCSSMGWKLCFRNRLQRKRGKNKFCYCSIIYR